MKTKTIVLALALMASAVPARAAEWYILDARTATCVPAHSVSQRFGLGDRFDSPYNLETAERAAGSWKQTHVERGPGGVVESAAVIGSDGVGTLFFLNQATCELRKNYGLKAGILNNPNDLK